MNPLPSIPLFSYSLCPSCLCCRESSPSTHAFFSISSASAFCIVAGSLSSTSPRFVWRLSTLSALSRVLPLRPLVLYNLCLRSLYCQQSSQYVALRSLCCQKLPTVRPLRLIASASARRIVASPSPKRPLVLRILCLRSMYCRRCSTTTFFVLCCIHG